MFHHMIFKPTTFSLHIPSIEINDSVELKERASRWHHLKEQLQSPSQAHYSHL